MALTWVKIANLKGPKGDQGPQGAAGNVSAWKANTAYLAGQTVVAPSGDLVTAKAAFTSTASYDAANWNASTQDTRIGTLEPKHVAVSSAGSVTDTRTNVGVRVPFKLPFNTTKFRVHIENRNPGTGRKFAGALTGTAIGVGQQSTFGEIVSSGLVDAAASVIQGSFTTPADGSEYVSPWKTDYPLTSDTWYSISYGYTGPTQHNYTGNGLAWVNAAASSVLNKAPAGMVEEARVPLNVWIEAYPDSQAKPTLIQVGLTSTTSLTRVNTFGDSLTDGGSNGVLWPEPDSWPSKLQASYFGVGVTNLGFSGACVDDLLLRTGVRSPRFSVTGGVIPSSGSVNITTESTIGVPNTGTFSIAGRLGGVFGNLNRLSGGELRFYTYGAAPDTTISGPVLFKPTTQAIADATAVIWIGINDITNGITGVDATVADHVIGGIQDLIGWLGHQRYMLLGVTTRTPETTGTTNNTIATEINDRLRSLYPGHFKSVQKYLQERALADMGVTPTQADTDAIAAGTLPPSVLDGSDITHINKAAAAVVATNLVKPYLSAKGWVRG